MFTSAGNELNHIPALIFDDRNIKTYNANSVKAIVITNNCEESASYSQTTAYKNIALPPFEPLTQHERSPFSKRHKK